MKTFLIEHKSEAYWKAVKLRREVLRYPLGLDFSDEQLEAETEVLHYVYECGGEVLGSAQGLIHENGSVQVKQVATRPDVRRMGVGTKLMSFVENDLAQRGFKEVFLHARDASIPFYEKLGYESFDSEFVEVGIPHRKMKKAVMPK